MVRYPTRMQSFSQTLSITLTYNEISTKSRDTVSLLQWNFQQPKKLN